MEFPVDVPYNQATLRARLVDGSHVDHPNTPNKKNKSCGVIPKI